MFFVGATGQLLTLLLTVGLPFVFLFSGAGNIEAKAPVVQVRMRPVHHEFLVVDSHKASQTENAVGQLQKCFKTCRYFCSPGLLQKELPQIWKTIYSKSSGNKAPPLV